MGDIGPIFLHHEVELTAACHRPGRREAIEDGVPCPCRGSVASKCLPQRSTTGSPSMTTATAAPMSASRSKLAANASPIASKAGLTVPPNGRVAVASPEIPSRRSRVHHPCASILMSSLGLTRICLQKGTLARLCQGGCGCRNKTPDSGPQFPNPRAPPEIHDAIGQINGGRIPAGRNHPA